VGAPGFERAAGVACRPRFSRKKAALNAIQMLERWPNEWLPGWVETMTSVARDEAAHLAQVTRILIRRGGRLERGHKNPYANALRGWCERAKWWLRLSTGCSFRR